MDTGRLRSRLFAAVKLLVLVAVVSPFVVYAVPQVVGAHASFVVLSGSMEPTLSPGDAIIVDDVAPSQIERGDIVTYRDGESPTTHRVVDVSRTEEGLAFVTKGDANEEADPQPVTADRVVGRVMHPDVPGYGEVLLVLPYLGYVVQFSDRPVGFALLVVAPFALLVLTELWSLTRSVSGTQSTGENGGESASDDGVGDGATGEVARGETQSGDAKTYTLTPTDVRLTLGVLAFVVPYTGWVAYLEREGWAIAVAVAATLAFLFGATVVVAGRRRSGASEAGTTSSHRRRSATSPVDDTPPGDGEGGETASTSADGGFEEGVLESAASTPETSRQEGDIE